jgi:sulfur-carrier protein adenylyltransferase/sulfurtransferase
MTTRSWIAAAVAAVCLWAAGCSTTEPTAKRSVRLPAVITVRELSDRMKSGKAPVLLDVREASERAVSTLPGSLHIPLGELPKRLGSLNQNSEIVVFCHSGRRSEDAVELMRARGFHGARSLAGGLSQWSREIGTPPPPS